MAIESIAIYSASDPSTIATDFHERAKPTVLDLGATHVMAAVALTGELTGAYIVNSQWPSLSALTDGMSAIAAKLAPGGDMADVAETVELQQRLIAQTQLEKGEATGPFIATTRFTFTGPLDGIDHAADIAMATGANGIRIATMLYAGAWSGHLVGSVFVDSLDTAVAVTAASVADEKWVADVEQAGAVLQSRTAFQVI